MEKNITKPIKTEFSVMLDFLFIILVLVFMSMVNYGLRPLYIFIISIASSYVADLICLYLRRKKFDKKDLSAIVSGGIIALMMPASVPIGILIITDIFSIVIGKQIFGGKGNMIFNCSATALAFASVCWKNSILMYPVPNEVISFSSDISSGLTSSLTNVLDWATIPAVSDFDIMLGKFTGPMGATHIIILIVCAVVLMFRRSLPASVFISGFVSIAFLSYIFPKFGDSRLTSMYYEMISGMTIFGLIFLASDYYTSPRNGLSGILYGISIGIVTSVFRHIGSVENAIVFAVIIVNPLKNTLDKFSIYLKRSFRHTIKDFINLRSSAKNKLGPTETPQ